MIKRIVFSLSVALASTAAFTAPRTLEQELAVISHDHETAVYETEDTDARRKVLDGILARAIELQKRFPDRGIARAWIGWLKLDIASTMTNPAEMAPLFAAGRDNLLAAVEMEPSCCGSAAYTSLALIYQFPMSGKDESAAVRGYFEKALAAEPDGLVPNTRYAGFLMRAGDYENATKHVNAALAAPPLKDRPGEDRSVRGRAQEILEQINYRKKK